MHGAAGPDFTREHKILGGLMLGVADAAYNQWVLRLDPHRIAMFRRANLPVPTIAPQPTEPTQHQPDNVIVTPKEKTAKNGKAKGK